MRLPLPIRRPLQTAALSRIPVLACALPLALSVLLVPPASARAVPAPRVVDRVAAALARPVDAARYPQAGAVVLLEDIRVTLDAQGRRTVEHHMLLKILQDRALRELSDQKVPFRGDTDRCEVLTALTHLPDGSTRRPEPEGLMEVSDPEAASAPFYSNARLKVVSFPAVQIGAVLELKYRITPRADAPADSLEPFTGELLLGGGEPILDQSLVLTVPAGITLKYQTFNGAPAPQTSPVGGNVQYAWTLRDVPQLLPEPGMVPVAQLVPRVAWSAVPDREQLGRWLYQRFQKAAQPDPVVTAQALALTAGLTSPEARRSGWPCSSPGISRTWPWAWAGWATGPVRHRSSWPTAMRMSGTSTSCSRPCWKRWACRPGRCWCTRSGCRCPTWPAWASTRGCWPGWSCRADPGSTT